jgi:hypothetical protein
VQPKVGGALRHYIGGCWKQRKEKKNQEEMNRKPEDIIRKKKEQDSILYMCAGI